MLTDKLSLSTQYTLTITMFPLLIGASLLLIVSVVQYYRKNRGLPPDRARLPFTGNIHQ